MHLYTEAASKEVTICKNGTVFGNQFICECREECDIRKCYNNQEIYDDGCACKPNCKIDCRNRKHCQTNCEDECKSFEFTEKSEKKLIQKFYDFKNADKPGILILATCYSEKSEVNKLLWQYGLYAALSISKERGELTDGRIYKLDKDQKIVIRKVHQDHVQARKSGKIKETKNIVLCGHAGTGKQKYIFFIIQVFIKALCKQNIHYTLYSFTN
jgi:hypothetical protein